MYVVIIDLLVDKFDVVRVVSGERFVFRINFDSDIEDVYFKIVYVIIKGWC